MAVQQPQKMKLEDSCGGRTAIKMICQTCQIICFISAVSFTTKAACFRSSFVAEPAFRIKSSISTISATAARLL